MSEPPGVMAPNYAYHAQTFPPQPTASNQQIPNKDEGFLPFGEDGLTFFDLIDVVNPLQHIPIFSAIYRNLTGDTMDPASKIAGGALFGGPIGAAASLAGVILKEATGKGIGEHVLAFFTGEEDQESGTEIASVGKGGGAQRESVLAQSQEAVSRYANYAEVLEWAQGEVNAGYVVSPIQNAGIPSTSPDHIEVSQWAQRVANADSTYSETPVMTGAEFALLSAEVDALNASVETADLPTNPSAPPTNENYEVNEEKIASFISNDVEVSRWAERELEIATAKPQTTEQVSWINELKISAKESYWKGLKLASTAPIYSIDQKY
ncbi:MAG TPA: hypothetical protein ENI79_02385 [Rhodospirillales bacterium]|nr:hypothetical protein [Rhodospirillales bacterium]